MRRPSLETRLDFLSDFQLKRLNIEFGFMLHCSERCRWLVEIAVFLLDTNICIAALKGNPKVQAKLSQYAGRIYLNVIVLAELQFGVEKQALLAQAHSKNTPYNRTLLKRFIDTTDGVLAMDIATTQVYAAIRAKHEKKGVVTGPHDLWIAAHAIQLGAVLVTANSREFDCIPGLRSQNWLDG